MTDQEIERAAAEYCEKTADKSSTFNTLCINDLIKFAKYCLDIHSRELRKSNGGYNSITAALYEKKYQDAESARKRLLEENDKLRCDNRELRMQLIATGTEE